MQGEERWMGMATVDREPVTNTITIDRRSGYEPQTGIYHSLVSLNEQQQIPTQPNLDTATYVLSQFPAPDQAETRVALIDSSTNRRVTYAQLHRSITVLAAGLYHGLGVRKDDVVFILSPNSLMFPTICLAVLSIGAVITTANPLNTAVPPVILGLVKYNGGGYDLSSLRRVGSGAAPLSKEVADRFREKFPWVELRPGYGLTESSGAGTFFESHGEAKARPASSARLAPCFSAKVVDLETGFALPPNREGELWLKSPTVMKEYLGKKEATAATLDSDGWLKTGDLCYFDEEGYIYIVDRIKELIKHNGYQVAPAELEAILTAHPHITDAAVIPLEDEEAGQIPVAYIVRAAGMELTEDQVIQFVANQVAPYKKIRRVSFINAIPRSAAGKILRRQLVSESKQHVVSKL